MPAQSATFAVLSCAAAIADELHVEAAECRRLLELLSLVPDPRKRRGVLHSVAAVLAGSRSVLAIREWAAEAPQVVLAALGARHNPVTSRFRAPHADTFRRVLRPVDADDFDMAIGLFLAERAGISASDCPPGETDGSAQNGHHDPQRRDHGGQPQLSAQATGAQAGHAGTVGGRQGRARGDSTGRARGAPAGGDTP